MGWKTLLAASAVLLTLGPIAWADVLVTLEGEAIETTGPWKVKGRQIVFTSLTGVLSSMRLSEIDLEASNQATRKANEPVEDVSPEAAEKPVAKKRPATRVLTNDNIGDGRETAEADAAEWGRELGQAMGEAMAGLTSGMMAGLAEGLGAEGQTEPMDDQMAEGFAPFADFIAAAAEIGVLAAAVEEEHDLDTPDGMRAAADDFDRLAGEARRRGDDGSPGFQEAMESIASQLQEYAALARKDPEAAVELRRQKMAENAESMP